MGRGILLLLAHPCSDNTSHNISMAASSSHLATRQVACCFPCVHKCQATSSSPTQSDKREAADCHIISPPPHQDKRQTAASNAALSSLPLLLHTKQLSNSFLRPFMVIRFMPSLHRCQKRRSLPWISHVVSWLPAFTLHHSGCHGVYVCPTIGMNKDERLELESYSKPMGNHLQKLQRASHI